MKTKTLQTYYFNRKRVWLRRVWAPWMTMPLDVIGCQVMPVGGNQENLMEAAFRQYSLN